MKNANSNHTLEKPLRTLFGTYLRFVSTVLLEGDEKLHSSSSITIRITCGSSGKITSCRSKACREGLAAEAAKKVKVWFQGALDPQKVGVNSSFPFP